MADKKDKAKKWKHAAKVRHQKHRQKWSEEENEMKELEERCRNVSIILLVIFLYRHSEFPIENIAISDDYGSVIHRIRSGVHLVLVFMLATANRSLHTI